jgi:hypothetical protein
MQSLGWLGGKLAVGLVKASGYFLQGVTNAIVDEVVPLPPVIPQPQPVSVEEQTALLLSRVILIAIPFFIIVCLGMCVKV